jgi:hypothetical protein
MTHTELLEDMSRRRAAEGDWEGEMGRGPRIFLADGFDSERRGSSYVASYPFRSNDLRVVKKRRDCLEIVEVHRLDRGKAKESTRDFGTAVSTIHTRDLELERFAWR